MHRHKVVSALEARVTCQWGFSQPWHSLLISTMSMISQDLRGVSLPQLIQRHNLIWMIQSSRIWLNQETKLIKVTKEYHRRSNSSKLELTRKPFSDHLRVEWFPYLKSSLHSQPANWSHALEVPAEQTMPWAQSMEAIQETMAMSCLCRAVTLLSRVAHSIIWHSS